MSEHLLEVRGLRTWFETPKGTVKAVDGVDLTLNRGEILGLVGESGSGKSITGFSLLGLVDPPGKVVEGDIRFQGEDLRAASARRQRALRGNRIAMIFQDPMMTLNPVLRIGTQMIETVQAHEKVSKSEARRRARDALGMVGIPHPEERIDAYPHEFSGGMRQRVAIAIALLHKPDLIIADEPTTALDVTIQSQILSEVQSLTRDLGMGLIWISHDLGVVGQLANKVAVMYAGRIVERGAVDDVLDRPRHPYTRGLLDSLPMENDRGQPLRQIPGNAPPPLNRPEGCPFRPRCARASEACLAEPAETGTAARAWRCFHPLEQTGVFA
ncbi:ABC transporter ATP-binding protein [Pseudooceanicola sediminis]|uniref:ABC transporter ATP-binding protein n=1 Tax=Pseudooceanicola sediminis TaxID=2211117 RepID=A0A399J1H4_9RHOB|nr:ABC transporter ATP-binding protein [Pseudooceanicola sediminis]KAA2316294.1 ABC transporter ATP-binding protein [Puniceibacterium sp. HSS470]RII39205.1 ABC transporter ATP-binding protein [Pseudooceanicola sediminis]|tara:strand:- start:30244 stop:31224 length:981 start_codon:yes stop_codon:yes gene_type:complete